MPRTRWTSRSLASLRPWNSLSPCVADREALLPARRVADVGEQLLEALGVARDAVEDDLVVRRPLVVGRRVEVLADERERGQAQVDVQPALVGRSGWGCARSPWPGSRPDRSAAGAAAVPAAGQRQRDAASAAAASSQAASARPPAGRGRRDEREREDAVEPGQRERVARPRASRARPRARRRARAAGAGRRERGDGLGGQAVAVEHDAQARRDVARRPERVDGRRDRGTGVAVARRAKKGRVLNSSHRRFMRVGTCTDSIPPEWVPCKYPHASARRERRPDLGRRWPRPAGLGAAQIHVRSLEPRRPGWARDDGRWIYPASLIKLPLAVAVGPRSRPAGCAGTRRSTVDAANMTVNDTPSPLVPGYRSTVERAGHADAAALGQRRDQRALRPARARAATPTSTRSGFPQTFFRRKLSGALPLIDDPAATGRNSHPAREAADLLAAIAADASRRPPRCARSWRRRGGTSSSRAGSSRATRFAHKTGDTDEVAHDAGILTLRRRRALGPGRLHRAAQQRRERPALRGVHARAAAVPARCRRSRQARSHQGRSGVAPNAPLQPLVTQE